MECTIRREKEEDIKEIFEINLQAFERDNEAKLVDSLRDQGKLSLSMVYEDLTHDPRLIAHVAFSPVELSQIQGSLRVLGMGPVGVRPNQQKKGVGSRLINVALDECRRIGVDLVFVLGDSKFYGRFGFVKAADFNLAWDQGEPEYFQVLELKKDSLEHFKKQTSQVTVSYDKLFNSC